MTHSEPDLSDALAFARKRADERLANTPMGDREAVSRTVAALAEAWGEDPAAIVRVIEGDSALARLVRKLYLEPVPPKRGPGWSADVERRHERFALFGSFRSKGMSVEVARAAAADVLTERGEPITQDGLKKYFRRAKARFMTRLVVAPGPLPDMFHRDRDPG